eukprot:TRINITY_DN12372_c0_g1_i1.p2 TRINITY_DN12372_c0_g1~~TRINITY_DN12372_c0_g1_i1.p2  ORF type:complete len:241 (-),score=32.75 TRINITY_DN12372_c0_g1_i1:10-732(-)
MGASESTAPEESLPKEVICKILSFTVHFTHDALQMATLSKTLAKLVLSAEASLMWKNIALAAPVHDHLKAAPRVKNWYSYVKARSLAARDARSDPYGAKNPRPIENCGLAFPRVGEFGTIDDEALGLRWELRCPLVWENLKGALVERGPFSVRPNELTCTVCQHDVRWVYTQAELSQAVQDGVCVIYDVGGNDPQKFRVMGKRRPPTELEIRETQERNQKMASRAIERVTERATSPTWQF